MEAGKTGRPVTEVAHSDLPLLCVWNELDGIDDAVPFGPQFERQSPPCCSSWREIAWVATIFAIVCCLGSLVHLFFTEPGVVLEVGMTSLLVAVGAHIGGFALGRLTAPAPKSVHSAWRSTVVEPYCTEEMEDHLMEMKAQGIDDNGWLGEYVDEEEPSGGGTWTHQRRGAMHKSYTKDVGTFSAVSMQFTKTASTASSIVDDGYNGRDSLHINEDASVFLADLPWSLDTFVFEMLPDVQGKPILTMGIYLMDHTHLPLVSSIPDWMLNKEVAPQGSSILRDLRIRVQNFLQELDRKYVATNPYHNGTHACDVMKNVKCFFETEKIRYLQQCREWTWFISVIAAAMHDMGHTGQTNNYHIAVRSDLALRYNDKSPLEQMHVSLAFQLMKDKPNTDWFGAFLKEIKIEEKNKIMPIQSRFRRTLISMVLATDNLKHNECCQRLKHLIAADNVKELLKSDSETQLLVLETILHGADISHPTYDLSMHVSWASLVLEEFWLQGDLEKKVLGVASMPMFDREKMDCPGAQIGFFKFVALGLWDPLSTLLPELDTRLIQMKKNLKYWEKRKDEGALSMPSPADATCPSLRSSLFSTKLSTGFSTKLSTGTSTRVVSPRRSPR